MAEERVFQDRPGGDGMTRKSFLWRSTAATGLVTLPLLGRAATALGAKSLGAAKPRLGGNLTVGFVGGGSTETLDPNASISIIDNARAHTLYDQVVDMQPDGNVALGPAIDLLEPNAAGTVWTMRVREHATWHDGSPVTAEDVIATWRWVGSSAGAVSPSHPAALSIDLPKMKQLDSRTVRLPLTSPNFEFPGLLTFFTIVKGGKPSFNPPIGNGPFKFVSWTPGRQSVFDRYDEYAGPGVHPAYVDKLTMVSIPDQTARSNALLAGEIDAMEALTIEQAKQYQNSSAIKILRANGPSNVPMYMACTLEPFTDVRVRQAMRLIANRPQLIATAQDGFGTLGNDVYGRGYAGYDNALPQRVQDSEKAKSLLKAAGKENLTVVLNSSTAAPGMLESALVYSQQAKAAGVTVKVSTGPADTYYGPNYLKQAFAQSQWFAQPIVANFSTSLLPSSSTNETHWNDPAWNKIWAQALATKGATQRQDLFNELDTILYDNGGYILWGYYPLQDGLSPKVQGAVPNPNEPLGLFDFVNWWLT
jgi:peptide/nickel transport system substrate-binding protein